MTEIRTRQVWAGLYEQSARNTKTNKTGSLLSSGSFQRLGETVLIKLTIIQVVNKIRKSNSGPVQWLFCNFRVLIYFPIGNK